MAQHASRLFVKRPGKHAVRTLVTALAVAAVMPAALASPAEAAELANLASAVTVGKLRQTGTATPGEIIAMARRVGGG